MAEAEQLQSALDRIHDIAESLFELPDLPIRVRQAFEEIIALARHKPDPITELPADSEGPFALGGGSIMDPKDLTA